VGNANEDLPVLRVTWEEARACAEWLGGRLPTPKELDVAAGYYDDEARQVRGGAGWGDGAAVNRAREGPRPVSKKDKSPSEIYDLAGNGREWTNEKFLTRDEKEYVVELRGWSYTEPQPLRYDKLKQWIDNKEELRPVQRPGHASFTTGFRIVIPVEAPR
jgi:formylglycine-generating enzyme required for sulfatase activity